ncbi:MAG: GNAT family N-acetyltransferase [Deltaproteobacteria bacterium]|nr:GNAT family N-acetyltransferase [Deltaproteobacteria bacterium]
MIGEILTTERLILKPLGLEDTQGLTRYVSLNREWLDPWEPSHQASYYTLEGQSNLLRQCEEERRRGTGVLFGVILRLASGSASDGEIIGRISITGIVRGIWQNGFVGYSIASEFSGQGYMTEALARVVRFGFHDLGLHRLQASIIPRNRASVRIAEKCHFRHEGQALRYLLINNVWEDHDLYALTREDLSGRPG